MLLDISFSKPLVTISWSLLSFSSKRGIFLVDLADPWELQSKIKLKAGLVEVHAIKWAKDPTQLASAVLSGVILPKSQIFDLVSSTSMEPLSYYGKWRMMESGQTPRKLFVTGARLFLHQSPSSPHLYFADEL